MSQISSQLMENANALSVNFTEALHAGTRGEPGGAPVGLEQMIKGVSGIVPQLAEMELSGGGLPWHKQVSEEEAGPLNAQLLRSARATLAFADAAGVGAQGAALGTARALMEAMPPEWRLWALQDASKMSASWGNELNAIKNKALVEMGQEPKTGYHFRGEEPKPQEVRVASTTSSGQPTRIEPNHFVNMMVLENLSFVQPQGAQSWPGQEHPEVLGNLLRHVREPLLAIKAQEMRTGLSFGDQRADMPQFYKTMVDIEACNAAMALSLHAQAFDLPPDGPVVGAMKGVMSLASHQAQSDVISRGMFMPNASWGAESSRAAKAVEFEAKIGALRPASASAAAVAPEVAGVEGDRVRALMEAIGERSAPSKPSADFESMGFQAGKMLAGFVKEWSPSAIRQKISGASDRLRQRAEGVVMGLNESADRATGFVAAPLMGARAAAGQKAAAVKEGLNEWAHDKAAKAAGWADGKVEQAAGFVGSVGVLTHAGVANAKAKVGGVALSVKDRLPTEQALTEAGLEKQRKAVKWASIGGALLVGVAMAPVAGVVFAAVGGWAAYAGFDKGLAKGAEMFRGVAGAVPAKLDNIADRLGARREAIQRAEPEMGPVAHKV